MKRVQMNFIAQTLDIHLLLHATGEVDQRGFGSTVAGAVWYSNGSRS